MKRTGRMLALLLVAAGAVVAVATFAMAAGGGPKVCPKLWAPVICDGGKIFANQCEADRHHATNCVPYGIP